MSVQRIEQNLARTAADLLPDTITKELRTRYRALPVMLHSSGLAATYAFIAAKANGDDRLADAYDRVARGIRERLREQSLLTQAQTVDHRTVLRELGTVDSRSTCARRRRSPRSPPG